MLMYREYVIRLHADPEISSISALLGFSGPDHTTHLSKHDSYGGREVIAIQAYIFPIEAPAFHCKILIT